MENIKDKINKMFYKFINKKIHPFFTDIYSVNEKAGDYIMYQKNFITEKIDYEENKLPTSLTIKNKNQEELTKDDLIQINKELRKTMTMTSIYQIVFKISTYIIPENIPKDMKKPNILVIGAGPIGLFISCYIKKYYGSKFNVVLYDNYIEKPGFKKPYNRYRPFQTSSTYLSLIVPKLYCLTNKDYIYVNIFLLEYLLYSQTILKYNIPIIYKDYKWKDYKKIIDENKVKFVFDCSGGRLKTNVFKNVDDSWLTTDKKDTLLKKELEIIPEENIVKLKDTSDKFIKNHYYGSLNVYNKDLKFYNKFDIDINSIEDLKYLNNIKKKYYSFDSIKIIVKGIKDNINRNFLYNILIDRNYDDFIFQIDVWTINIRHTIQSAELINENCLYIKAGDSMFHSHFITGAGLNRTIEFAVKCVHYLDF